MKIAKFEKGSKTRTPLHTAAIMEIVDPLNGLLNLKILPTGIGKLEVAEESATLTLNLKAVAASLLHPFKPIALGGSLCRVVYGTVNGIAPAGMAVGDSPAYSVTLPSTSGYAQCCVHTDADDLVDARSIVYASTLTADNFAARLFYRQIFSWNTVGGALVFGEGWTTSQEFELCGGLVPKWYGVQTSS